MRQLTNVRRWSASGDVGRDAADAAVDSARTHMWWKRSNHRLNVINPYLGVGYKVPEGWSARKLDSWGGVQLLPPVTQSVYPAALLLRVFPDMQNMSPEYAVDQYITAQSSAAAMFTEHGRDFKVHSSGFVYASVEYTIEANNFTRTESHHIVAYDIDGRASVTASSCSEYWPHLVSTRDAFVASLAVFRPELAITDHISQDASHQ